MTVPVNLFSFNVYFLEQSHWTICGKYVLNTLVAVKS